MNTQPTFARATVLEIVWRAYISGTWPLQNGDKLIRPRWDWYLQRLSELPELSNTVASGAVRSGSAWGRGRP